MFAFRAAFEILVTLDIVMNVFSSNSSSTEDLILLYNTEWKMLQLLGNKTIPSRQNKVIAVMGQLSHDEQAWVSNPRKSNFLKTIFSIRFVLVHRENNRMEKHLKYLGCINRPIQASGQIT